jgi:hypothetical protein
VRFRNKIIFTASAVNPCPTSKMEDHPLSVIGDCLLNNSQLTSMSEGRLLLPQPEDASYLGEKGPI